MFLPQSHLAVSPGSTQALLPGQHPCLGKYRPLMPFWICWPIYCPKPLDPEFLVDGDLWFAFLWLHLRPRKTQVAESERYHSWAEARGAGVSVICVSPSCSYSLSYLSYLPSTSEISTVTSGKIAFKGHSMRFLN